jgi:RimJ/RimL family protein N-acetyltransferase
VSVEIRPLERTDEEALREFFAALPPGDRGFLKEDGREPAVLRRWIDDERGLRLVAVDERPGLAAVCEIWPGIGRSSHVGDVRLVVADDRRRQGVGGLVARRALVDALRRGMSKLTVEVVASEQGTIDMFQQLGFTPEALLRDHLRDPDGELHDVLLLAHIADDAGFDVLLARPETADE